MAQPLAIWSDLGGSKHQPRWVEPSGAYLWHRETGPRLARCCRLPVTVAVHAGQFPTDVYLSERHHIVLVDELLFGELGAGVRKQMPTR